MLDTYHPLLDAANVDLKSFRNETYKSLCGASLQPVLDSMKKMKQQGVWVEVTTLLIPGITDSKEEIKDIAEYIKNELGSETPWHVSRFYPDYQLMDRPPTAPRVVQEAREIGIKTGLKYVYADNLPGDKGENTYCPECKEIVIERTGYNIIKNKIIKGRCPICQAKIDGRWTDENE
jgi:pyruvate formate lyase activating enzyme